MAVSPVILDTNSKPQLVPFSNQPGGVTIVNQGEVAVVLTTDQNGSSPFPLAPGGTQTSLGPMFAAAAGGSLYCAPGNQTINNGYPVTITGTAVVEISGPVEAEITGPVTVEGSVSIAGTTTIDIGAANEIVIGNTPGGTGPGYVANSTDACVEESFDDTNAHTVIPVAAGTAVLIGSISIIGTANDIVTISDENGGFYAVILGPTGSAPFYLNHTATGPITVRQTNDTITAHATQYTICYKVA